MDYNVFSSEGWYEYLFGVSNGQYYKGYWIAKGAFQYAREES